MTTWKQTKKANFKWNQYVKLFVDGEQVTDTTQVRDTAAYDEYEVDEMFGYNGMTKVTLVKPNADEGNREAETAKLHAYHECDERPVEMMVGKAMCAYANWQNSINNMLMVESDNDKTMFRQNAIAFKNEFEATIRCIEMFVRENIYTIESMVKNRAKAEFDIK